MNISRLRTNTPVLIGVIKQEFNLSNKDISKVFRIHPRIVRQWEAGNLQPDEDYINALIWAYRYIHFTRPLRLLTRIVVQSLKNVFQYTSKSIRRRFRKTDQISFF